MSTELVTLNERELRNKSKNSAPGLKNSSHNEELVRLNPELSLRNWRSCLVDWI